MLYKESIHTSETLQSIKNIFSKRFENANFGLYIWDNSPNAQSLDDIYSLKETCIGLKDLEYNHDSSNKSLSYVYNEALDLFLEQDYLVILDQDSKFKEDYINEFLSVVEDFQYDLILPVIKFKDTIVSPTKINYIKGSYYKYAPYGKIEPSRISAINSGMIISLPYVKRIGFRYDKNLKNYCTDDYFMLNFRRFGGALYVLNYNFSHDLSLSTLNENSLSLRERYKLMKEGRYIVYSSNIIDKCMIRMYFFIHKIYMAIKYKDKEYLKV
ncbi:glycosyltransferase [Enterobacter huaxiensis]|uniref:glycosyltransferase n=1 Tax=Enterobacter huaxiensis TaxID=2494702 RepID=UPI002175A8DE|nr:glycosyltransferase [Enterobacter huaxiensis]MCS5449769.1 glycosyltransferase [Enterobacter huaxiensis]